MSALRENKQSGQPAGGFHEANRRRRARFAVVFAALFAALAAITVLNINTGNISISPSGILRILLTGEGAPEEVNIVRMIRLPRIMMAALLGGALSVSGFLLQTYFANPIAGPFVLGISSGAKMAVAFLMVAALDRGIRLTSVSLVAAAFAGALCVTVFILLVSRSVRSMSALLVAGIMVGYICSAATDFVVTFAEDSSIVNLHNWSKGSFSGMTWEHVNVSALIIAVCMAAVLLLAKPIGACQLGEGYAVSVGVNVRRLRTCLILLSCVLSACVTAYAGPVSFVGIAVPFLIKKCLSSSRPLAVIPAAFLGGAVFTMGCDLIARTAFAPTEMNISTVTSVFGAPVVIFMLVRRQKERL